MPTIKEAIEEFREKRLGVYKADHDQIVRDTRVAERAAKDHVGRWLFELLQNSDDAEACQVRILIKDDTVYVADNGRGLKPEAVSAICGTDFSDKTTGTIGRLGNREVDFVCERKGERLYVQVAYLIPDKKTWDREFGNLLKIQDNYPKIVVSMDKMTEGGEKGVQHMQVLQFLRALV